MTSTEDSFCKFPPPDAAYQTNGRQWTACRKLCTKKIVAQLPAIGIRWPLPLAPDWSFPTRLSFLKGGSSPGVVCRNGT